MEPTRFLKLLAAVGIGVGTALLAPFVPSRLAGTALTGFGTRLHGLYARTPGLRRAGRTRPAPSGTSLHKGPSPGGIGLSPLASHEPYDQERSPPVAPGPATHPPDPAPPSPRTP